MENNQAASQEAADYGTPADQGIAAARQDNWIDEMMRRPQNFLLFPYGGADPIEVQPIDGGFWAILKYGRVELELDANQAAKLFRELNNTSHFVPTGEAS
jgi:hypothetical protein